MIPAFGAKPSPVDIRTFSVSVKSYPNIKGGQKYSPTDIEDQDKVGICTAISLTQNARKATGKQWSAEFQYLMQKMIYDKDWDEGSSIFSAVRVAKNIGLLPADEWTYTTQADRNLSYHEYAKKLQAVPPSEITRLMQIAGKFKISAYATVPVTRDAMAAAIDNSKSGILARFALGNEWYTSIAGATTWDKDFIQPLRSPKTIISGHAVTESNYDGGSFRIANTWSSSWADGGTAYHLLSGYQPTECWAVWYPDEVLPKEIESQLESRASIIGKITDLLQQIVALVLKLA